MSWCAMVSFLFVGNFSRHRQCASACLPLPLSSSLADPLTRDVAWAVVHKDMELAFEHRLLVERVKDRLAAYW